MKRGAKRRIKIKHGYATVSADCDKKTIQALNKLSEAIHKMSISDLIKIKNKQLPKIRL